jgi:diguanylate cyclase
MHGAHFSSILGKTTQAVIFHRVIAHVMKQPNQPAAKTEPPKSPSEIAREAIRHLTGKRLPPTPENFAQAYNEVAGIKPGAAPAPAAAETAVKRDDPKWPDLLRSLVRQWDLHQSGLTPGRKKEMLERVLINFGNDAHVLHEKLGALTQSWSRGGSGDKDETVAEKEATPAKSKPKTTPPEISETAPAAAATVATVETVATLVNVQASTPDCQPLLQALHDNLLLLAGSCQEHWPDLSKQAAQLAKAVDGRSQLETAQFEAWSALWRKLLIHVEDDHELAAGLKRLMGLLFLNIGELVGDEAWLAGQLTAMQNLMAGELHAELLIEAERGLRDLAYKQGVLKGGLEEARSRLKDLVSTFIDRVGEMSQSADGYHTRIGEYSEKISQARDITELGDVVGGLSADIGSLRDALRSNRDELISARTQAEQAEKRVEELQAELTQVSNLVREDQLTGALNRRGMDEAFERELARTARLQAPLSIGMLDLDHFKKLNDSLGHQAGDEALRHLTRVVHGLLRPTDTLARYGGEEFLILLPNTDLAEAEQVLKRIQRELTRQFFLHDNERVLITFSAGVAELATGESQSALVARADAAMYSAKKLGRNRVERG